MAWILPYVPSIPSRARHIVGAQYVNKLMNEWLILPPKRISKIGINKKENFSMNRVCVFYQYISILYTFLTTMNDPTLHGPALAMA